MDDLSIIEKELEDMNKNIGYLYRSFHELLSFLCLGVGGLGILLALILWRVW